MVEEVIGRHFKNAKAKQKKIILEHIRAVMECVKPSFLFDMVAASTKKLQEFLLELNQEIDQKLVLLCVDSVHPFFGQRQAMLCALELDHSLGTSTFLVDVSGDLEYPVLIKDSQRKPKMLSMLKAVIQKLSTDQSCHMEIQLEPEWPGCTLFGILLGFLVVYYHEANQENCLAMVQLKVFNLKKNEIAVSSFSVPNALLQSNQDMICALERWKKENTSDSTLISEELVMLPNVIM